MKTKRLAKRFSAIFMAIAMTAGLLQLPMPVYAEPAEEEITEIAAAETEMPDEAPLEENGESAIQAGAEITSEADGEVSEWGNAAYFRYGYGDGIREHILFTDRKLTISIVTNTESELSGMVENALKNAENISWHVTHWDNEKGESYPDTTDVDWKVSDDGRSIELSAKEGVTDGGVDVCAEIRIDEENMIWLDGDGQPYVRIQEPERQAWFGGENDALLGDSYGISESIPMWVRDADHFEGEDVPIRVLSVASSNEDVVLVKPWENKEERGWELKLQKCGESKITVSYEWENGGKTEQVTKEYTICVRDTVYWLYVDFSTGTSQLLPGASLTLQASAEMRASVPTDEDEFFDRSFYDYDKLKEMGYRISYRVENNDGKDQIVSVKEEDGGLKITANEKKSDDYNYHDVKVIMTLKDAEGRICGEQEQWVYIVEDYMQLFTDDEGSTSIQEDMLLGDTQTIKPVLKRFNLEYPQGKTVKARFEVEASEKGVFEIKAGTDGSYTFTRKSNDSTNLRVRSFFTDEESNEEYEASGLDWNIRSMDYQIWLEYENDVRRLFTDGGKVTAKLMTGNEEAKALLEKKVPGVQIVWYATHWDEDKQQPIPDGGEGNANLVKTKVSDDGRSFTVEYNPDTDGRWNEETKTGYLGVDVWATIEYENQVICETQGDRYIDLCDPTVNLFQEDEYWNALFGWGYRIDKEITTWVENAKYPYGEDATILVTSVQCDADNVDENHNASDPDCIKIIESEDQSGWDVNALDKGGYACVSVEYEVLYKDGLKSESKTHILHVYVGNEVNNIWIPMDTDCLLPGESREYKIIMSTERIYEKDSPEYKYYEFGESDTNDDNKDGFIVTPYGSSDPNKEWKRVYTENPLRLKELGYSVMIKDKPDREGVRGELTEKDGVYVFQVTADEKQIDGNDQFYFGIAMECTDDEETWEVGYSEVRVMVTNEYYLLKDQDGKTYGNYDGAVGSVLSFAPTLWKYNQKNREGVIVEADRYIWSNPDESKEPAVIEQQKDGSWLIVRKEPEFFNINLTAQMKDKHRDEYYDVGGYWFNYDMTEQTECVHEFTGIKNAKEATCTADGYTGDEYCRFCEEIIKSGEKILKKGQKLPAKGHSWDAGKVTTAATATTDGVKTYTCSVCKQTKTEKIAATGSPAPAPTPVPTQPEPKPATVGTVCEDTAANAKVKVTKPGSVKDGKVVDAEASYLKPVNASAKTVTVPAEVTIDGIRYKVTAIADNAFKNNKKLTKVTIGKNIVSIGKNAFSGCKKLGTVNIKGKLKKIDASAFAGCTALKKVVLPASVTTIGKKAFYGAKALKSVTFKGTAVKSIGKDAFKNIHKKAAIKVPKKKKADYKKKLKKSGYKGTVK